MNIKSLRLSKKMTQTELANALNIERTTVSMWETGNSKPRYDMLIKLSKLFNCSIDDLIDKKVANE